MLERHELSQDAPRSADDVKTLRTLAQAAVKAEHVTGDTAWNTFVSYLTRALEVAEQQKLEALARLASPVMVNEQQVAQTRNLIFRLDERITVLNWVIGMPEEIKRVGSVAREKLLRMETDREEGNIQNG